MKRLAVLLALLLGGSAMYGDAAREAVKEDVVSFQEQTLRDTGEYKQIAPNQDVGSRKLAPNIRVDVYDGTRGKGYTVTEITDTQVIITDYGNEGRSAIYNLPAKTATSTP